MGVGSDVEYNKVWRHDECDNVQPVAISQSQRSPRVCIAVNIVGLTTVRRKMTAFVSTNVLKVRMCGHIPCVGPASAPADP